MSASSVKHFFCPYGKLGNGRELGFEVPVAIERAKKRGEEGPKVAAGAFHEPTQTLTGERGGILRVRRTFIVYFEPEMVI